MYKEIIELHINGNNSDFKVAIKRLTKRKMLILINTWVNEYNCELWEVLRILDRVLL